MKKILKTALIIMLILLSNFVMLQNTVKAVENQITVYTTGNFNRILKYDGVLLKTARAVYKGENGTEYPAYCLDVTLTGVGDKIATYDTVTEGKITDVGLWRVIVNGYPYQSFETLGVQTEEEAYIATKQAVYCYKFGRMPEKYIGIGEAGERVVNAIKTILANAEKTTQEPGEPNVAITPDKKWKEEKEYITKEYLVTGNMEFNTYKIKLENEPKGCRITNLKNEEKQEFNSNEKFKISIPIKSLEKSGNFKIYIETQIESKPVFYGKAPSGEYQNYALTAFSYEFVDTNIEEEYPQNDTEITVEKEDNETKQKLAGAKFQILDENKKVIQEVETDKNGQIKLKQVLPGKYYIKEIEAPEGYEKNEEIKEIEIKLNEKITVTIGNSKIVIIEEPKEPETVVEIPKLPVTGM